MALSEETMSKCSGHLSAYKAACEDHPNLKSFDDSLQQRTNKVIESLTVGAKTGSLSQHAVHMEVTKNLLEVSQGVANFILESENDVWENKTLRSLVNAYFDSTIKTLEIFDNVKNCVEKAEMGQLIILEAVAQFDKESAEKYDDGKKKKYEKTLKKLKKFKAMGDPFDGSELTIQFKLMKKLLESLLEEVSEAKEKLHEEYTNLKKASIISNVVFGAAFALVAIASVVLMATGVGAVAVVGFADLSLSLIGMGWVGVQNTLEKQKDALKRLEDIPSSVKIGVETTKKALATVSQLVHQLETKISSMLEVVDNAIESEEDEVDTRLALNLIKDKVKELTEKIKEVGENVANHSKLIVEARYHVLEKINGSGKYHHV